MGNVKEQDYQQQCRFKAFKELEDLIGEVERTEFTGEISLLLHIRNGSIVGAESTRERKVKF